MTAHETVPDTRPIEVGDVFVESWGYEQTNVNAYVVVRTTKTMIALKPCGLEIVGGRVRPVPERVLEFDDRGQGRHRIGKINARGEILKKKATGWRGEPWITLTTYSGASRWDGSSTYHETYASGGMGH